MSKPAKRYAMPDFLSGQIQSAQYERWLVRKARAHLKRDRGRGHGTATGEQFRLAIHQAVLESRGKDAYTGEALDWKRISTFNSEKAKAGGRKYKQQFALLPTVDHVGDGTTGAEFKICAWRTNDAKSDLRLAEFLELCERVLAHAGNDLSAPLELQRETDSKFHDGTTKSTRIGYINKNQQRCDGTRGAKGTDYNAIIYKMTCLAIREGRACGHQYGANGTDVFQRKCPKCQGGKPGLIC